MSQVNVLEAKNRLSSLIRDLETGREDVVVIARRDKPVVRMTRIDDQNASKRLGIAKGRTLAKDGWDSDEVNAEIGALFGVGL